MKKQDANGVRTPLDVERRHKLGAIPTLETDVEELKEDTTVDSSFSSSSEHAVQNKVITAAIGLLDENKVNKETGKGLSSNDFTDAYKTKLDYLYPVGAVYLSSIAVDVATLSTMYGGTWELGSNVGSYFSYIRTL